MVARMLSWKQAHAVGCAFVRLTLEYNDVEAEWKELTHECHATAYGGSGIGREVISGGWAVRDEPWIVVMAYSWRRRGLATLQLARWHVALTVDVVIVCELNG